MNNFLTENLSTPTNQLENDDIFVQAEEAASDLLHERIEISVRGWRDTLPFNDRNERATAVEQFWTDFKIGLETLKDIELYSDVEIDDDNKPHTRLFYDMLILVIQKVARESEDVNDRDYFTEVFLNTIIDEIDDAKLNTLYI